MHIETINIHIQQAESSMARAFIESLLRNPELNEGPGEISPAPVAASTTVTPPKIGEYWDDMGGIYAGVARGLEGTPDYHLILCKEAPKKNFAWQDALDLAKTITADGHNDFSVPTRFESALLYANLQDQFETDTWHWTSTQYSEYDAWNQGFDDGNQGNDSKAYELRCRFVRRSIL